MTSQPPSQVSLGPKIAEGGEGRIHEVSNPKNCLAKLYHRPASELQRRKLEAMVRIRTPELEAVAAWPVAVLKRGGSCIGFVMPRISGAGIIDQLMHPEEQRKAFPTVDYGFLLHVAMNLMRAASTLHKSGCVIGDVNESNVFVHLDGTVRFIDVDSFQLTHDGQQLRCTVGKPLYTPPELQGAVFRDVARNPAHDSFGLAVLVFQLLMQGRHPFSGVHGDGRGRTIEEAIRDGLYAHSIRLRDRVTPPPHCVPVSMLGNLGDMFERSFLGTNRPTTAEWMAALDSSRKALRCCARNRRHRFMSSCSSCPLCKLPHDPLPDLRGSQTTPVDLGCASVEQLIQAAHRLPPLRAVATRCRVPINSAVQQVCARGIPNWKVAPPTANPTSNEWDSVSGCGCLILLTGTLGLFFYFSGAVSAWVIGIGCLMLMAGLAGSSARTRTARAGTGLPVAWQRLVAIEMRAASVELEASTVLAQAAKAVAVALDLVRISQQEVAGGSHPRTNYATGRHGLFEYLKSQPISGASIPGVLGWQAQALTECGFVTAADVEWNRIRAISHSDLLADSLMQWRRGLESRFQSSPIGRASSDPPWQQDPTLQHSTARAAHIAQLRIALESHHRLTSVYEPKLNALAAELDDARRLLPGPTS